MKPKKIKARRYWQRPKSQYLYDTKKVAQYYSGFAAAEVAPVVLLPADAASVERMVEQANYGIIGLTDTGKPWTSYDAARAALAAIGIKSTKST